MPEKKLILGKFFLFFLISFSCLLTTRNVHAESTSAQPDFIVSNIYVDNNFVFAVVKNIGESSAVAPDIKITNNDTGEVYGDYFWVNDPAPFLPGAFKLVRTYAEIAYPTSATSVSFTAIVDPQNLIAESREDNNSFTKQARVNITDFIVSDIKYADGIFTVSGKNIGGEESSCRGNGPYKNLDITITNNVTKERYPLLPLAPMSDCPEGWEYSTFNTPAIALNPASQELNVTATVDSNNNFLETDESNNTLTKIFNLASTGTDQSPAADFIVKDIGYNQATKMISVYVQNIGGLFDVPSNLPIEATVKINKTGKIYHSLYFQQSVINANEAFVLRAGPLELSDISNPLSLTAQFNPNAALAERSMSNNALTKDIALNLSGQLPDFIVKNVEFGQGMAKVTVQNIGAAYAVNADQTVNVDVKNTQTNKIYSAAVKVNAATIAKYGTATALAGPFDISDVSPSLPLLATVDPKNSIVETNDNNNTLAKTLKVDVRPDFAITDIKSDGVNAIVRFVNKGENFSTDKPLTISIANLRTKQSGTKSLTQNSYVPNTVYEINFPNVGIMSFSNTIVLKAVVDSAKVFVEKSESNTSVRNVTIYRPDFAITALSMVKDGTKYFPVVTVANKGSNYNAVKADGITPVKVRVKVITPKGEIITRTMDLNEQAYPAKFTKEVRLGSIDNLNAYSSVRLNADVDGDGTELLLGRKYGLVLESNENNNTASKSIGISTVKQIPATVSSALTQ